MIKRIKSSLLAKVFLATAVMLLCISLLVFGLLAWMMPQTYSNKLNANLDERTQELISELEQVAYSDSGGLFDQFISAADISYIELYSQDGRSIAIPNTLAMTQTTTYVDAAIEQVDVAVALKDTVPTLSSTYYFSFSDSTERYTLVVYGEAAQIAEIQQSFLQIFPVILVAIVVISLLASWLYSRIITSPVVRISGISTKMSAMELDWKLDENRTDELGTLEKSLNTLSRSLSTALSDLKSANAKLEEDIEYERALEQAQRDFFSAASHELKTPITIIKGQIEGMLLGIGAYKDREKYLSRALEVANTLERMVQEILTISRLDTSDSVLKTAPFDCVPIIHRYLSETEDLIVQKSLQIDLHLPKSVTVTGNIALIEKVFSNLIGNAIKYAPEGATVQVSAQEVNGRHLFTVANTGSNIPEEALPKLFDAFYRVDQSRNRKTGGSGLGLYLVQKVLQQHNSQCYVGNTESGVEFWFTL